VDVHNYLSGLGVDHEIVLLEAEARDALHAAALCGMEPAEMADSRIFEADGQPVLVLAPGGTRVSKKALAKCLGASECRALAAADAMRIADYPAGAIPPVALKTQMPLVVDASFKDAQCVYASAGERHAILKVRLDDLLSANPDGRLAPVT
jgi:prolyl-tRNA editing enzyme YbaK/EbsC (Cys-tRNA(Pro) deacylase)